MSYHTIIRASECHIGSVISEESKKLSGADMCEIIVILSQYIAYQDGQR
jgi:hypothetical protein